MPLPKTIRGKTDINSNPAKVWTIKLTDGPLQGSTINLRNFSSSGKKTRAKYTIEIIKSTDGKKSPIKSNRIEIKFEE